MIASIGQDTPRGTQTDAQQSRATATRPEPPKRSNASTCQIELRTPSRVTAGPAPQIVTRARETSNAEHKPAPVAGDVRLHGNDF